MAANTLSVEDAKAANFSLIEDEEKGKQAVHDVIVALRANRRSGTAHTKTRGEVSETGKKPYRQKGTGRARQGGNASPIKRGGGVVFGPRNEKDYSKKVSKKVRRLAFNKALSERIKEGAVVVAGDLSVDDGKTKNFVSQLRDLTDGKKVLIVGSFDELTFRAARNVKSVLLMSPGEVNTEHLLYHDAIVLLEGAKEALAKRTQN